MWVKSKINKKGEFGWSDYYLKIPGMTFLDEEGDSVWVGFCLPGEKANDRHIEIIDHNDLIKIQYHRQATNCWPQPMPKV